MSPYFILAQYEDDTRLYEVILKPSLFELAARNAAVDDVSIREVQADDYFGFEIVDAILGGEYNRYLGHENELSKPVIRWHGYSSYPVHYQKVCQINCVWRAVGLKKSVATLQLK